MRSHCSMIVAHEDVDDPEGIKTGRGPMRSRRYTIVVHEEVNNSEGIEQVASPGDFVALCIAQVEVRKYADVPGLDAGDTGALTLPLVIVNVSGQIGLFILRTQSRFPRLIPIITLAKYISNLSDVLMLR